MSTALWVFGALLGAVAVVRLIDFFLSMVVAPSEFNFCVIVPLEGEIENIEEIVMDIVWQMKWRQSKTCQRIYLADFGLANSTRKLCERLCDAREGVFMITPEAIGEVLKPR